MTTRPQEQSGAANWAHPSELGLLDYWQALREQRWLIAAITVGVVVLVGVVTLLMTPQYRATSTLQIERDAMNVVNVENLLPAESPLDRDFYETQYELLRSRSLARAVIHEAGLARDPEYKEIVDKVTARLDAAKGEAGKSVATRQEQIERALVGPVLESLEIEPVRNSRLVRVNFNSPDPQLAAKVANTYAKVFIDASQERKLQATSFASKYLSDRLAQLRSRVEESEKSLVDYSSQEQIVSVGQDKPSLPAQNLTELNVMLAAAQDARIRAEAAWRQASTGDGMGLPQVVANPLIQSLRSEQVRLTSDYQQKLATFKPQYPEMQRIQSQIAELNRQIREEVANIRQSLKETYDAASLQEDLLEQRITGLKNQELDLQTRSIRYNMLKRDADTNRQIYDALLQRYKEIGVAGNVGTNNISVVDGADVPGRPSSPKLLLNLVLAGMLGLFIAVAVALLRYFLRDASAKGAAG